MQLSYLKKIIDEFGEEAAKVACDTLNDVIHDVEKQAKENLHEQGIKGTRMYDGFKLKDADVNRPEAVIAVEVWSEKPTKNPININSGIYNSKGYANIGRIIEFSPRIQRPFFYDAFYKRRKGLEDEIRAKVAEVIKDANRKSE